MRLEVRQGCLEWPEMPLFYPMHLRVVGWAQRLHSDALYIIATQRLVESTRPSDFLK